MNTYEHFIIIEDGKIIDCFTSANKNKRDISGKIKIGTGLRQFPEKKYFPMGLFDQEGKPNYKYLDVHSGPEGIRELEDSEKTTVEEERISSLKRLEEKYIEKIQNKLGIERYRALNNPEISAILAEYDEKKALIHSKKAISTIKKIEI